MKIVIYINGNCNNILFDVLSNSIIQKIINSLKKQNINYSIVLNLTYETYHIFKTKYSVNIIRNKLNSLFNKYILFENVCISVITQYLLNNDYDYFIEIPENTFITTDNLKFHNDNQLNWLSYYSNLNISNNNLSYLNNVEKLVNLKKIDISNITINYNLNLNLKLKKKIERNDYNYFNENYMKLFGIIHKYY